MSERFKNGIFFVFVGLVMMMLALYLAVNLANEKDENNAKKESYHRMEIYGEVTEVDVCNETYVIEDCCDNGTYLFEERSLYEEGETGYFSFYEKDGEYFRVRPICYLDIVAVLGAFLGLVIL